MAKRYFFLLCTCMFFLNIYSQNTGDYRTKQSGQWNNFSSWERFDGNSWVIPWDTLAADKYPDKTNDSGRFFNVSILSLDTIILTVGSEACNNLIVESGAQLLSTNSGINRYLEVFGNITCNGTIGNGNTYNVISFRISGSSCIISGSGNFDCSVIKSGDGSISDTSVNLTIDMDINLSNNGTVFHNTNYNTNFNIRINEGIAIMLTNPLGNVAIDGTSGAGTPKSGGHIQVFGSLIIPNILYLTSQNTTGGAGPFPCTITIENTGKITTQYILADSSLSHGHYFNMKSGSVLEITGDTNAFINFSAVNNYYNLEEGSTIIYSSNTNADVNILTNDTFPYQNLIFTGNGNRNFSDTLTINGNFSNQLYSGQFLSDNSSIIYLKGDWTSENHAQFDESGIQVNFIGMGTQVIDANADYEEFDKITIDYGSFVVSKDSISTQDITLTDGTLKVNTGISILNNYTGSSSSFISFAGNNNFEVSGNGIIPI